MTSAYTLDEQYHQWLTQRAATTERPLLPAATVVLLREENSGPEILLLRRNPELRFMGGMWVFPGGRTDPADYPEGATENRTDDAESPPLMPGSRRAYSAARAAAVRETQEETGLKLHAEELVPHSHWLPPAQIPQQFATWLFVCAAPNGIVHIDGEEIQDWTWISASQAIRRHDSATLEIAPPTYITLLDLARSATADEAIRTARSKPPTFYSTVLLDLNDGGQAALWEGDAGYEIGARTETVHPSGADHRGQRRSDDSKESAAHALTAPGGRHRLWMPKDRPWRYERSSTQAKR